MVRPIEPVPEGWPRRSDGMLRWCYVTRYGWSVQYSERDWVTNAERAKEDFLDLYDHEYKFAFMTIGKDPHSLRNGDEK